MSIVMLDPGNFTPAYLAGLCDALEGLGESTRILTSPPLFEPGPNRRPGKVRWLFSPWLRRVGILRHHRRLRRLLRGMGYPVGIWRTWRLLKTDPPGILHVHWALVPPLDRWLLRRLKRRGWRIIYTVHDPLPERRFGRLLFRRLLACVDAAIVHTEHLREVLLSACPELDGRVHVIVHGATPTPLPSDPEVRHARSALGLPEDLPLIGFCGMLKPYKGVDTLLDAFAQVRRVNPAARLVVAGEPLMPLRRLETLITRLGLRDAVVFRPVFIPGHQLPLYFIAPDLIVAPYRRAAASGIVIQAQSYGRAVVVTRVGGLPEAVEADRSGLVVPPDDPEALAAALVAALAQPDVTRAMGQRGWTRIGREHDWTLVARQTLELYRRHPCP